MRTKIRKRQTRGGVRWYVSFVDDSGEHAHGGYATRREATTAAASLVTDARWGRYVPPAKLTLGAYLLQGWLPSRENADISENSRDVERIMVDGWIVPHLGHIELQKLSARDLDQLYATLRKQGGRRGQPLRGKSVRNVHGVLSKSLGDAVRRGHLVANPTLAVDPPARDDTIDRTAWTRDEVLRFLDVASMDRLGGIWRLALTSGLRRGEFIGLQWPDLDGNGLTVARQVLVRPAGGYSRIYVRSTTKTRRTRRVRIDDATAEGLRRWKATQSEERLAFGAPWHTDAGLGVEAAWVVTEPDGTIVHPATFGARWERLVASAAVTPITLAFRTAHLRRAGPFGRRAPRRRVSPTRARQHHHYCQHLRPRLRGLSK